MLAPGKRGLYTDALVPPPGFRIEFALGTCFSMELPTLLSIPIQLVMQATEDRQEMLADPVTLYESLQRCTHKTLVFVERGGIQAPSTTHLLFSMLEDVIYEVKAPGGGVFHPKLWFLNFINEDGDNRYRLLLPTKNITSDRAWDIALTLEGEPGSADAANNEPLIRLLRRLPGVVKGRPFAHSADLEQICDDLRSVQWHLPEGFDEIDFHLLGLDDERWLPRANDRLAVISPFIKSQALAALARTSKRPLALISRADELSGLETPAPFTNQYVLHDAAETEDGEDVDSESTEIGLHAKAYIFDVGESTHLVIGSANATNAALLSRNNVEILAELSGLGRNVGRVKDLINPNLEGGLGPFLVPWEAHETAEESEESGDQARRLEEARRQLIDAEPFLVCEPEGEQWSLALHTKEPLSEDLPDGRFWPVTLSNDRAAALSGSEEVIGVIQMQSPASLTGLCAFEFKIGDERLTFVLNLSVEGMPELRDRSILRHVVNNKEGFLRYLLLLLAGLGDGADVGSMARALGKFDWRASSHPEDLLPLLEEMVRAFSREPRRLEKVRDLVADLSSDDEAAHVLPHGFTQFWEVFDEALGERTG